MNTRRHDSDALLLQLLRLHCTANVCQSRRTLLDFPLFVSFPNGVRFVLLYLTYELSRDSHATTLRRSLKRGAIDSLLHVSEVHWGARDMTRQ